MLLSQEVERARLNPFLEPHSKRFCGQSCSKWLELSEEGATEKSGVKIGCCISLTRTSATPRKGRDACVAAAPLLLLYSAAAADAVGLAVFVAQPTPVNCISLSCWLCVCSLQRAGRLSSA